MARKDFLRIDDLPGEATDNPHQGSIELLKWEPGLKIWLYTQDATAKLHLARQTKRVFKSAVITLTEDGKDLFQFKYDDLYVVQGASVGTAFGARPAEMFQFEFIKTPPKDRGPPPSDRSPPSAHP